MATQCWYYPARYVLDSRLILLAIATSIQIRSIAVLNRPTSAKEELFNGCKRLLVVYNLTFIQTLLTNGRQLWLQCLRISLRIQQHHPFQLSIREMLQRSVSIYRILVPYLVHTHFCPRILSAWIQYLWKLSEIRKWNRWQNNWMMPLSGQILSPKGQTKSTSMNFHDCNRPLQDPNMAFRSMPHHPWLLGHHSICWMLRQMVSFVKWNFIY